MATTVYISNVRLFEWDDDKRGLDHDRHKLDLIDSQHLFHGRTVITRPSPRGEELRFVTVGRIGSNSYAVVWTERRGAIRLISFRRARYAEERAYRARIG
jgi:uncharacterized DUF497 family protein